MWNKAAGRAHRKDESSHSSSPSRVERWTAITDYIFHNKATVLE